MQLDYLYKSVNSKLTKINLFFLKSPESRAAQLGQQSMLSFHTQVLSIINEHPVHLHHWSKNQGVALFSSLAPMYLFCLVPLPFQSPERITNDRSTLHWCPPTTWEEIDESSSRKDSGQLTVGTSWQIFRKKQNPICLKYARDEECRMLGGSSPSPTAGLEPRPLILNKVPLRDKPLP